MSSLFPGASARRGILLARGRAMVNAVAVAVAAAAAAGACHGPGGTERGAAAGVVARFGDDEITAAQVDARILALPAAERPKPGEDLDGWYRDQIREMVVDRRLLAAAREEQLEEKGPFVAARREAEKQIGLQLCVAELRPEIGKITEADLRAAFEARAGELSAPERRLLYQIFLRREPGALEKIRSLRERVLAGESFSRLASQYSQSETRHRKGFVGWMVRGRLPAGFEKVVFALEEGVPSRPISTREGFDLFYVDQVLPAKELTFEEARPLLRKRLEAERRNAALDELDAEVEAPAGSLVLDRDGLAAVVEAGDADAPVLRLGEETWTLADLRRRVQAFMSREARGRGAPTLELAWQILDQARRREELYLDCRRGGHIPGDRLAVRLDRWRRRALIDGERHRRLVALAAKDEDRLRLFYESNLGNFSKPPTWKIRRLRIPLGPRAAAVMARLETAATTPGTRLAALQGDLGGELDELGPKSLAELGRLEPKLPGLVAPLEAGGLSAPFRSGSRLEMAEVVARTPAVPVPFEEVRGQVAARYVQQYTAELYDRLRGEVLRGTDLEIDPDALAALRRAGLPQPDISVEQLEDLLDQLR